jgi:hypothetical protein
MTFGKEAGDNSSATLLGILGTGFGRSLRTSGAAVSIQNAHPEQLLALCHAAVAVGRDGT